MLIYVLCGIYKNIKTIFILRQSVKAANAIASTINLCLLIIAFQWP